MSHPPPERWRASTPDEARAWLAPVTCRWWIAGGWALDLHLGRQTRPHADLDAGCFRDELSALRAGLPGWAFYAAHGGRLTRLGASEPPAAEVNGLWCHPADAGEWWLQLLLDEREGRDWVFRRDRRVRLPARALLATDAHGTPYLRPEVQLLYKAKAPREKDETDLRAVIPALRAEERSWLAQALDRWHPEHPWLGALRRAG